MKGDERLHWDLTQAIIGAFYDVYNELGYGFLEKIYENAFAHELRKRGFVVKQQMPIRVYYDQQLMGEFYADLVINDLVIVELKAVEHVIDKHIAQLFNYLKATEIEVGLLFNFGVKPGFRRRVFTNKRKKIRAYLNNPQNPRTKYRSKA